MCVVCVWWRITKRNRRQVGGLIEYSARDRRRRVPPSLSLFNQDGGGDRGREFLFCFPPAIRTARAIYYIYKSEVGPVVINQTVVIADDFGRCREGAAAIVLL